ncbi:MAG TPA: hypothetical protein PLF40_18610 [Kofleriaceae bacterium]|nr:hypothetical protein [Kofleriaceae bacterium]
MKKTPGMMELIAAGWRGVTRYTGTLFTVFVAQSLVALICLVMLSQVFASVFAQRPMFDEGVRGDLIALVWAARYGSSTLIASAWLVVGVALLWSIASWFLVGGVNAVLLKRPEGRAATARQFGAGGVNTFLKYGLLTFLSVPFLVVVLFVLGMCATVAVPKMQYALTMPQLLAPLALALLPALFLLAVGWTVLDYARLDLSQHRDSHELGAFSAYFRALRLVVTRPLTIGHTLLGWLVWLAIGVGYSYIAFGHPMLGAGGAVTLYVIRLGVQLLRMATKFAVMAGQAYLHEQRTAPPRTVEADIVAAAK